MAHAATLIGVAPTTIRRWTAEGRIACWRLPSGERRYDLADVQRLRRELREEQAVLAGVGTG